MMNILFDCERMKYSDTGIYHFCLNLGTHLQQHINPLKINLDFYTPPGVNHLFGEKSNHIIQNSLHKFFMPSLRDYNVWHATFQDSYYIPFRNRKIKVVLTIHDLNFLYDESKSEDRKSKHLRRLQKLVQRADAIVCISEYCKKDVLFYCDIGNKPVYVIHNGTNTLQEPELSSNSYVPNKPFLFSLGTICPKKNFHSLFSLLLQNNDMELVIAGKYDNAEYIRYIINTAESLGIDDKIRLIGQITENEKAWYFNNCRAFVFPSLSEGFGLPVTEAMSVGKPLFLSNRTALPEIGSNVAFYFPNFSHSCMQETYVKGMQQYEKLKMYDLIKKRGQDFSWHKAAKEYINVYNSLC